MSWARKLEGSWPIARKWRGGVGRKNNGLREEGNAMGREKGIRVLGNMEE